MLVGLTGGIRSGQRMVVAMLQRQGAALVDTDLIARQLTLPGGAAIPAVAASFGPALVGADGGLDRAAMRDLVFRDAGAKQRLESILHPMIGAEASRQAAAAAAAHIVFDVPLLAESAHWRDRVDRVLVVDCLESTQRERVARRAGWTRDAASAVIAQQASRTSRRRCADAVIYNDGLTLVQLAHEVDALCAWWFATE